MKERARMRSGGRPCQDLLLPVNAKKITGYFQLSLRHFRQVIQRQEMVSAMKYALALHVDQHEVYPNRTGSGEAKEFSLRRVLFRIKLHFNDGNEFTSFAIHPKHDVYTNQRFGIKRR